MGTLHDITIDLKFYNRDFIQIIAHLDNERKFNNVGLVPRSLLLDF